MNHLSSPYHYLQLMLWLVCSLSLNAFGQAVAAQPESHWDLSLGIGAGIRTNPVMDNGDMPLLLIPKLNYQRDQFFIQNLDIGYTLLNSDQQQLSLLLTPSYDQIFFNSWDSNNFILQSQDMGFANNPTVGNLDKKANSIDKQKLHKRRMAALAGLEYSSAYHGLDIQTQLLHEITSYYNGDELRLALSKNINLGKQDVKLTLAANWQSQKTLNYFYGLDSQEANYNQIYSPASGITTLLRLDWSYQLNNHWDLYFFTSYRHLSNPISASPLITNNNVITAFAGGVYHF